MPLAKLSSKLFFILLLTQCESFAQQKNDWQKMNLLGKPKLILLYSGGISKPDTGKFFFSPKGYLILQTSEYDGSSYRTEYIYNSSGLKTGIIVYKDKKLYMRKSFDPNNVTDDINTKRVNSAEIVTPINENSQEKRKYDEKGNKVLFEIYDKQSDGHLKMTYGEYYSFKFDKNGNWYEQKRSIKFKHIEELQDGGMTVRQIKYY